MTNLRRLLVALPLTALPALLAGCPIYGDGGGTRVVDCREDADCPGDLVCDGRGECVDPGDPCTSDDECSAGSICVGGACTPGSRDCRTHGDCVVGA